MKNWILATALFLTACAHTPTVEAIKAETPTVLEVERKLLFGRWLGEAPTKDGGSRKWLIDRRADGTFTVKFLLFKNGKKLMDQVEAGYWGITKNVYFTITREFINGEDVSPADTTLATFYDAYFVTNSTTKSFSYKSIASGDEFTVKKVDEKFRLE